ncbi:MAG: AAA family ATPase [Pseudomonadota bacterium]
MSVNVYDEWRQPPQSDQNDLQIQGERMGLEGLLTILRRQALIAITLIVVIMAAATFYLRTVEESYATRATIVLTPSETRISRTAAQLESFDVSRSIVETELDVLRSRQFAAEVAAQLDLATHPVFVPASDNPTISATERLAQIVDKLLASYSVSRSGESLAIEIVAETPDPELTAAIANGVAETYIRRSEQSQRREIQQSIRFLETRAEAMSVELSELDSQFTDFVRTNGLDDSDLLDRLLSEQMRLSAIRDALGGESRHETEFQRNQAALEEVDERLREHTAATLTLGRMERALSLQQTRYQNAVERLNELETQLDFVPRSARHVTVARVPVEPAWPNQKVALALSFIAATILAFITVLLLESLNRRVWTEADVQRITGLRNFGSVPRIPKESFWLSRPSPLKVLSADPRSYFNEGVRGILTLWFNKFRSHNAKVIMISSSLPNEGKSTVALSLAGSATRDGLKVLLLDFDFQGESAAALDGESSKTLSLEQMVQDFETGAKPIGGSEKFGETSVVEPISADAPIASADDFQVIRVDTQDGLNLHVLQEFQMKVIPELRERFDLILLDTPPVLVFDDACRFGPLADAVFIVVRWGRSKGNELREAYDRLSRGGLNVIGTVFNDVDPREQKRFSTGAYLGSAAYAKHRFV